MVGCLLFLGCLPSDGAHMVAVVKVGLPGVKHGDHSAVGKLNGAGIAQIAAGLEQTQWGIPHLAVIFTKACFDVSVATIAVSEDEAISMVGFLFIRRLRT